MRKCGKRCWCRHFLMVLVRQTPVVYQMLNIVNSIHLCSQLHLFLQGFRNLVRKIQALKITIYEKELNEKQIELEFAQEQIRPHFFLNCISLIHGIADNKGEIDIVTITSILSDYNDSAQKTPAVRKNVRGMNAPITNNATIIPTGFSSGIVGFSWPDVLQNAVIRCIALLFQEKHFR